MKSLILPLIIFFTTVGAIPSYGLSKPEEVPYSSTWDSNRYSHTVPWISTHASVGAAVMKLEPAVAFYDTAIGQYYGVGLVIHLNHLLGIALDMDTHSTRLEFDQVIAGWDFYEITNRMFTLALRVSPLHTEYFEVGIKIGAALNTLESEARQDTNLQKYSWVGTEFAQSLATEILFFPTHSLEIGCTIRGHYLMGGVDEGYYLAGTTPNSTRLAVGLGLHGGWHF